jgi:glycosyltransferase involved in cell wall biosynthesis
LDFVVNGVNGYMAPVGNSEELSRRIVQVCQSSDEQWKAMSDAAYATAVRYTWDDATDRFEAALTKAIAKSRTV